MRLYYIDESEGPRYYVRTALGVHAERWNDLHNRIRDWRLELRDRYAVPLDRELHACDLLAGRGKLVRIDGADRRLSPEHGAEIFIAGLSVVEDAARTIGGVEIVNVCLRKPDVRGYERASLDRLLNRVNSSVASANRHAFLIFDEGKEEMVARLYRRLRSRNPVPSRYEAWEDGERTRDIPIERVIGGPAFRSSHSDHMLQMADLIAHALLKQEEEPSPRVASDWASTGPSGSSTAPSTAGRPSETSRASSGGEGQRLLLLRLAVRTGFAVEHQLKAAGHSTGQLHDAIVAAPLGPSPSREPLLHGALRHPQEPGQVPSRQVSHLE